MLKSYNKKIIIQDFVCLLWPKFEVPNVQPPACRSPEAAEQNHRSSFSICQRNFSAPLTMHHVIVGDWRRVGKIHTIRRWKSAQLSPKAIHKTHLTHSHSLVWQLPRRSIQEQLFSLLQPSASHSHTWSTILKAVLIFVPSTVLIRKFLPALKVTQVKKLICIFSLFGNYTYLLGEHF